MSVPQYLPRTSVVGLCMGLFLSAAAVAVGPDRRVARQMENDQAAQEPIKTMQQLGSQYAQAAKAAEAARREAQVDFIARRLPGNEAVWYVMVFRTVSRSARTREFAIVQGKTAAAQKIFRFLERHPKIAQNPQSYSDWLQLEFYPNPWAARARYQALIGDTVRRGYR